MEKQPAVKMDAPEFCQGKLIEQANRIIENEQVYTLLRNTLLILCLCQEICTNFHAI